MMNSPMRFSSALALTLSLASTTSAADEFRGGEALDAAIQSERFKQITSVLFSVEGKQRYEAYWNDGSPTKLNDTRSAMKSVVAMAVGAAIADGHIKGVDQPAFQWFKSDRPFRFESPVKDAITIRDLLSMSSALHCDDNVWETPGNEEHMYPAKRWTFFGVDLPVEEGYERNAKGYGRFAYCTVGSFLLGQIVQRASDTPVDEYIGKRLLEPLGISRISWDRSPSNEVMTGGGAELTSRDLLTLGEMILNDGKHGETQVLPKAWVREMTRAHVKANDEQNYGYQWWQREFRCGDKMIDGWYMAGNGGNKIAVFRDVGLVAVVTATLYGTRGMHQQSTDIINEFVLPDVCS